MKLKIKIGVSTVSNYVILRYFPANQFVSPYVAYLRSPTESYYKEIGKYVASDVNFSNVSRQPKFVYGTRTYEDFETTYGIPFCTIKYAVYNCLVKIFDEMFFKSKLKHRSPQDYELLIDMTIKDLDTEKYDDPNNVKITKQLKKIKKG